MKEQGCFQIQTQMSISMETQHFRLLATLRGKTKIVEGSGAVLKNARAKVRFEEKGKKTVQRPLSAKVGQGPGKVVL